MKYILEVAPKKVYSEIGQQKKVLFAFCNKKGNILTPIFDWVLCRDFLSDVLYAEENNTEVNKYNFVYNPAKNKIDRDKTRFLLKMNEEDVTNLSTNLNILNKIEKDNRLVSTIIKHVEKNVYLVEGSKMWMNNTFSLHLYTFLLKAMCYEYKDNDKWIKELQKEDTNEGRYAKSFIPQFESIVSKYLKTLFNKGSSVHGYTEEYTSVTYIHDCGGVQTLFRIGANNFVSTKSNKYYKRLVKILEKLQHGTD